MIVAKRGFKKRYAYGGSGIFDTIASLLTSLTGFKYFSKSNEFLTFNSCRFLILP